MEKSGVSVVVDGVSCFELRLDHTKSLNYSTPKLVPFLSLRERNNETSASPTERLVAVDQQVWCLNLQQVAAKTPSTPLKSTHRKSQGSTIRLMRGKQS